jgi:competence protein ComEC
MVAKPGDQLAVKGLDWQLVSSAGEVITKPVAGAGAANPYCADSKPNPDEGGVENSMSVGSVVTFGKFRVAHLGDLTQIKEFPLMCPINRLGTVDLWIVSHHGQPMSNSQVLVHALHPRVAILNNGTRKGGQPSAMKIIYAAPGLEDLWQLHFSLLSGQEYTSPGMFIANTIDDQPETARLQSQTRGMDLAKPTKQGWALRTEREDAAYRISNLKFKI